MASPVPRSESGLAISLTRRSTSADERASLTLERVLAELECQDVRAMPIAEITLEFITGRLRDSGFQSARGPLTATALTRSLYRANRTFDGIMGDVAMARREAIRAEAEADNGVETEPAKKRRENREKRLKRIKISLGQEDVLVPDDEGEYVGFVELRRSQGMITPQQKQPK